MKKLSVILILTLCLGVQAQEVSTLYFLENAPMRHTFNAAFQPVSEGYINFTPLGYTSFWAGNNSLTLMDAIYPSPEGTTVTALHPEYGNRQALLDAFHKTMTLRTDLSVDLVGFGFRIKDNGYFTFGITEKIDNKEYLPKSAVAFLLKGGEYTPETTTDFNLQSLGLGVQVYTEIAGGYSHRINDVWTVGGKIKLLLGSAYVGISHKQLDITSSSEAIQIQGQGNVMVAGPLNFEALPSTLNYETIQAFEYEQLVPDLSIIDYIKPSGYGAAVDLGFTATPIKQLQISVGINDLGLIHWNQARNYTSAIDTSFTGLNLEYGDYVYDGQFNTDSLLRGMVKQLEPFAMAYQLRDPIDHFFHMITTKINVGIDGRFFDNRLSVGVLSKTMLYDGHVNEEVTFGISGKPCHWFNIAATYSLIENGKYSNIGAGLSFMPYDGINLTLAADYIPTYYAPLNDMNIIPSRSKGFNLALGFSIVWGTNKKKE